MLHRQLLILQRFTASPFDALIAANAVNATLSRQDPVNLVERLDEKLLSVLWPLISSPFDVIIAIR